MLVEKGTLSLLILATLYLSATGHLASFRSSSSSEGRPRTNRGPTVPPFPPSEEDLLSASQEFLNHPPSPNTVYNLRSGYKTNDHGIVSRTGSGRSQRPIEQPKQKPIFMPVIGPRALSSVREYLGHIKENLEALVSSGENNEDENEWEGELYSGEDYDEENEQDVETDSKQHSRRHVEGRDEKPRYSGSDEIQSHHRWEPSLELDEAQPSHTHSTSSMQKFVEIGPHPQPTGTLILRRGVVPSSYNPSWGYTKLGLGRKRKRGNIRM